MNCKATNLSYQQTGYFSRIITDYLQNDASLRSFYAHPVSLEGVKSAIYARDQFKTNRKILVEELTKQYHNLELSVAVRDNIEKLSLENTYTITTAHQPAIFTGTLFFVYKILHTIKIAKYLSAELPEKNFVPVYYMGSEDADLDELGYIYLDNEKISWEAKQNGAVGRMKTRELKKSLIVSKGNFLFSLMERNWLPCCEIAISKVRTYKLPLLN